MGECETSSEVCPSSAGAPMGAVHTVMMRGRNRRVCVCQVLRARGGAVDSLKTQVYVLRELKSLEENKQERIVFREVKGYCEGVHGVQNLWALFPDIPILPPHQPVLSQFLVRQLQVQVCPE